MTSILNLFSTSDDELVHGKAVSPEEAQGETATEYLRGFDFENIWQIQADGYPILQWETDIDR